KHHRHVGFETLMLFFNIEIEWVGSYLPMFGAYALLIRLTIASADVISVIFFAIAKKPPLIASADAGVRLVMQKNKEEFCYE
ncbi:MAG: hypothetical protein V3U75_02690, partial [Methylococcaceae bacterium]